MGFRKETAVAPAPALAVEMGVGKQAEVGNLEKFVDVFGRYIIEICGDPVFNFQRFDQFLQRRPVGPKPSRHQQPGFRNASENFRHGLQRELHAFVRSYAPEQKHDPVIRRKAHLLSQRVRIDILPFVEIQASVGDDRNFVPGNAVVHHHLPAARFRMNDEMVAEPEQQGGQLDEDGRLFMGKNIVDRDCNGLAPEFESRADREKDGEKEAGSTIGREAGRLW